MDLWNRHLFVHFYIVITDNCIIIRTSRASAVKCRSESVKNSALSLFFPSLSWKFRPGTQPGTICPVDRVLSPKTQSQHWRGPVVDGRYFAWPSALNVLNVRVSFLCVGTWKLEPTFLLSFVIVTICMCHYSLVSHYSLVPTYVAHPTHNHDFYQRSSEVQFWKLDSWCLHVLIFFSCDLTFECIVYWYVLE